MKVDLEFIVKYHAPLENFKQKLCKIQIYFYVEHGENGLEREMCEPWETCQDTTENIWVTWSLERLWQWIPRGTNTLKSYLGARTQRTQE